MIKKICILVFTLVVLCEASLFATFNSTGVNSFTSTIDSKGNVTFYKANISYVEDGDAYRRVLLLFVPEQYASTLDGDTLFSQNDLGVGQYHLSSDTNYYTGGTPQVFYPANYEGVLTNEVIIHKKNNEPTVAPNYVSSPIELTFTDLALHSDPTKGLDTTKSYAVYFILRTTGEGFVIFRNAQRDNFTTNKLGGIMGSVLPIKITLKKKNPITGNYDETVINTHVVEGSTISYDTWPANEIAGDGYTIEAAKSSGAGTVTAQSGVGAVTTSNRKAQDLTIYYDFEGYKVTLNPKGGTIETDVIYVAKNKALPERDDLIPQKTCGRFLGWTTDSNATTVTVTSSTNITGDVTYYAVWENDHDFEYTVEDTALFARCTKQGCQYHDNSLKLFFQPQWSASLEAEVQPENASTKHLIWSSSDKGVLTVDQGRINGVAPGTATVTATAMDGSNVSTTCTVTLQVPQN